MPAIEGGPSPLEIVAHDTITGARTWTADARRADTGPQIRLDDNYLLFGERGGDWQALRRSDGAAAMLPVADTPGMCRAVGLWWTQRDDRLIALDLRGAVPTHRDAPAAFIPAEVRHQWSLVDCAARADEVVLRLDLEPWNTGRIVGLDPATLVARWTLDLPHPFRPLSPDPTSRAWPQQLGAIALVHQGPAGAATPCAVDLVAHRVLWCMQWNSSGVLSDGEDLLVYGERWIENQTTDLQLVRLSGVDGSITAAATVAGPTGLAARGPVRGGRVWLTFLEDDTTRTDAIALLSLDARTLRPAAPQAHGRFDVATRVRDAMSDLEVTFPRTPELPAPHVDDWPLGQVHLHAANPWNDVFHGHPPGELGFNDPYPDGADAILATVRARLGLPADVAFTVLARRLPLVAAFAVVPGDAPRWILVRGSSPEHVATRTFTRRPTPTDVYRFILEEGRYDIVTTPAGATDEAAWQALTGAPREAVWQVP